MIHEDVLTDIATEVGRRRPPEERPDPKLRILAAEARAFLGTQLYRELCAMAVITGPETPRHGMSHGEWMAHRAGQASIPAWMAWLARHEEPQGGSTDGR